MTPKLVGRRSNKEASLMEMCYHGTSHGVTTGGPKEDSYSVTTP